MRNISTLSILVLAMFALINGLVNPANAATRTDIKKIVIEEAGNSNVPPALALAIAKVESDFNKDARSTAGARGVMQIMPKTAKDEFGIDAEELWNPRLNIQLGIDFISQLHKKYGGSWELALSHYNGGTLDRRGGHAVAHTYTKAYVDSVLRWWRRYEDQSTVWKIAAAEKAEKQKDGWTPALTKVRSKLRKRLAKRNFARQRDGWNRRSYRRKGISGRTRISTSWRRNRPAYDKFDDHDADFDQRRQRARETLDDFGPNKSWPKG